VHSQEIENNQMQEEAFSNIEPIVDSESINLNDKNFEHLTQASSGATTGD
jgi:hypothetical protein